MLIAVEEKNSYVIYCNFRHTFVPYAVLHWRSCDMLCSSGFTRMTSMVMVVQNGQKQATRCEKVYSM